MIHEKEVCRPAGRPRAVCDDRRPSRGGNRPGTDGCRGERGLGTASPVDQTKVPHYFGPYPNWANSPLTLPDATVTISPIALPVAPVIVGNPLIARQYATDNTVGGAGSNAAGQGTVLVVIPTALPAGTLTSFQTYTQNDATFGSPDNVFNAYVLRPTGNADEYTVVFDSGAVDGSGRS